MTGFLFSVLGFFAVLTPVVFFHELGHYWAARRCGVVVEVFSVGFGREIFGFTDRHGTRWMFAAIPLGGYIRMAGDDDPASTPAPGAEDAEGSFHAASLAARSFIVAMGPIANFILGIAIIAAIYIGAGKPFIPAVVGEVVAGSAAEEAGLLAGDRITHADGRAVDDFAALRSIVFENPGQAIDLTINRDGGTLFRVATPHQVDDRCLGVRYGQLGIRSPPGEILEPGPGEAVLLATGDSFEMAFAMLRGLGRLAGGEAQRGEIGGPVKIAEISGRVAQQGLLSLAMFAALISINLGLVNLLPIPGLDGGHLVLFGLEGTMRRKLPPRLQDWVMRIGIASLVALILTLTVFDIWGVATKQC